MSEHAPPVPRGPHAFFDHGPIDEAPNRRVLNGNTASPLPCRAPSPRPMCMPCTGAAPPFFRDAPRVDAMLLFNGFFGYGAVVVDLRAAPAFASNRVRGAISARALLAELAPGGKDDCSPLLRNSPTIRRWRRRTHVYFCADNDVSEGEYAALVAPLWKRAGPDVRHALLDGGFVEWERRYPFLCEGKQAQLGEQPSQELDYPSEVLEGFLYLGSAAAYCEKVLRDLRVTHVVRVLPFAADEAVPGVSVLQVPLLDEVAEDIFSHFGEIFDFIDQARGQDGRVLVHCAQGVSRSATAVLSYLMSSQLWTKDAALQYLRVCRPIVRPNVGFIAQLDWLERMLTVASLRQQACEQRTDSLDVF